MSVSNQEKLASLQNVTLCFIGSSFTTKSAAICRKVAKAIDEIEIWGNGEQHRSFLYIDEAVKATIDFYRQDKYFEPVNIGSERNVSINELVDIVCNIAGKTLTKKHIPGPLGVHARTSHNALIKNVLGYAPDEDLEYGLTQTYKWIQGEIK